jgi:hypothetical protein
MRLPSCVCPPQSLLGNSSVNTFQWQQIHDSFQTHYGPDVNSASNRNEYQESSWGVKDGRRVKLTLQPSVSRLSKENLGDSMSHNPTGLQGLLQG